MLENNNNNNDYGEDENEDTTFGVTVNKGKKGKTTAISQVGSRTRPLLEETKAPVEQVVKAKVIKDVVVKIDEETII